MQNLLTLDNAKKGEKYVLSDGQITHWKVEHIYKLNTHKVFITLEREEYFNHPELPRYALIIFYDSIGMYSGLFSHYDSMIEYMLEEFEV